MTRKDPRVDAYIRNAAPFARPVLRHLRGLVHEAAPGIEETLKWRVPHFVQDGIVCGMAAFKAHCAFWFWRGGEVVGAKAAVRGDAMGRQFGRITSVDELPPRAALLGWVRKAVELNAGGPAPRPVTRKPPRPVVLPKSLGDALARNAAARAAFEAMSPSQRREYAEWIADAKRDETRERRIRTAIEWIAAGKPRNWKYMTDRKPQPARAATGRRPR